MQYNEGASLDTSGVQDVRGSRLGGHPVAVGGGGVGVVGLILFLLMQMLGGGGGGGGQVTDILGQLGGAGQPQTADNSQISQECKTGKDANEHLECAVVANIDSIQQFWAQTLGDRYQPTPTIWFSGTVNTACGTASSQSGPFYCPADSRVYIDLTFYEDLKTTFGATGGLFPNAYVLAHEYGHHVQHLLGTTERVGRETGPTSGAVRLELQADCYAGAWANHAETVPGANGQPLISDISEQDIKDALDTAARIGDDFIQSKLGNGRIDPGQFSHGTSQQRQKWFMTGYQSGDVRQCDTFSASNLG